jgi:hypothetical protein
MTQQEQIEIMRKALVEIALHSPMSGKPLLPRRDMQAAARRALKDAGYENWAQPVTGKAEPMPEYVRVHGVVFKT